MSKLFQYGGIVASIVLIAFGAGTVVTGYSGRDRVHNDLAREQIVGTPDSSIPNQLVNNGTKAEAFAKVMRKHTLEATGGQTYAQMGRYMGKDGKATNDEKLAAVDPKSGKPVDNPLRNLWVTETALTAVDAHDDGLEHGVLLFVSCVAAHIEPSQKPVTRSSCARTGVPSGPTTRARAENHCRNAEAPRGGGGLRGTPDMGSRVREVSSRRRHRPSRPLARCRSPPCRARAGRAGSARGSRNR